MIWAGKQSHTFGFNHLLLYTYSLSGSRKEKYSDCYSIVLLRWSSEGGHFCTFSCLCSVVVRCQENYIYFLAKKKKKIPWKQLQKIINLGKIYIAQKAQKKTKLNDNSKYIATKSRLPQPHHGSCSNTMAPAASLWLL